MTASLGDFSKLEIKVGKVVAAERVQGSEKLLRLEVNLGGAVDPDVRQIISGIGKTYAPDDLIGRNIIVFANLEPRQMMGLESQAMLLAALDDEGNLAILTTDKDIKPGSGVR